MSRRFRLLLALAFAGLAALLTLAYGNSVRAEAESERAEVLERFGGETAPVLVATQALDAGAVLNASALEVRTWPSELVPDGALNSVEEALGEALAHPLGAGAPVTETVLASRQRALVVPAGHAALTVPVGERTGVSDDLVAGTALVAYRVRDGACRLLCGPVRVLEAGEGALTVAVPAEHVAGMVTAASDGSLRLVVPAGDVNPEETGAALAEEPHIAESAAEDPEGPEGPAGPVDEPPGDAVAG